MIDLDIKHYFSGREYAKRMTLPAGHYAETHRHTYDHLSILASGRVEVTIDGVTTAYEGPDCITIRSGAEHRIEALTDSVWFCVHATEETDEANVDEVLIEKPCKTS
jgi:quercetin dioxygenase-like cupin family protein